MTRSHRNRCYAFTFIEVLAAVTILAFAVGALLLLSETSRKKMEKARDRMGHKHMLCQAAEFFLLFGPDAMIPEEVFPYEGYRAVCRLEAPEGLPDRMSEPVGDWKLRTFIIEIHSDERLVESVKIDKIVKEGR